MDGDCVKCIGPAKAILKTKYNLYKRAKRMAKKKQQFKLKQIKVYKVGMQCTPESVGDNEAIKILRANPEDIRLFEIYPKNWEALLSQPAKTKKPVDAAEKSDD